MRSWSVLLVLLLLPVGAAQLPHPHEGVVHHPLTIQSEMEAMRDKNPGLITMDSFGDSTLGFPLWYLDYAHPEAEPGLPVFYLDANHHGNEQLGMEALLIFMDQLADWSLTEEGAARLSEVRVVAAPMINPDGTGRNNRVNSNFVDLNRNYDYNWGLYGTSSMADPMGGTYRGEHAHSEPESAANAAFMQRIKPAVYLSMHTGSHDIVLPWRQAPDADGPMPDWPVYERYLSEIENASGLGYRDPSGAGESISFAYGRLGAISLIVEVDNLQSELIVEGRPERLKEEIAIFWRTLEVFDNLGGRLVQEGSDLVNVGWGSTGNITWLRNEHNWPEGGLVAPSLGPGERVALPSELQGGSYDVVYDRTIQGSVARLAAGEPASSLLQAAGHLQSEAWDVEPVEDAQEVPLPALAAALAVVLAFALRRRPA